MTIKIVNKSDNPMPMYETCDSAGFDLASNEDWVLQPDEHKLLKTGLFMEIPPGFEGQIRPRSGLAYKHRISIVNSPGTIDADYRGDVGIILENRGKEPFPIAKGDRIAQMVIAPIVHADLDEVEALGASIRGAGGFGHTGINTGNKPKAVSFHPEGKFEQTEVMYYGEGLEKEKEVWSDELAALRVIMERRNFDFADILEYDYIAGKIVPTSMPDSSHRDEEFDTYMVMISYNTNG